MFNVSAVLVFVSFSRSSIRVAQSLQSAMLLRSNSFSASACWPRVIALLPCFTLKPSRADHREQAKIAHAKLSCHLVLEAINVLCSCSGDDQTIHVHVNDELLLRHRHV
jgi:hypothetical protein